MAVFITGGQAAERVNYVGWIESTGTQKIDTGVAVKSTIGYEVEFALTTTSGEQGVIGGFTYGGYNHNFAAYNGQWVTQYGNNGQYMFGTADTNKHTLSQNVTAGVVKLDGTTIQTGLTYYNNTDKTFALFCYNGGSSYPKFWPGSLKLYRCRMYDNGILIRDFWPCCDPSGVACLYDKVESKYYYNQGSGEFVAGSDEENGGGGGGSVNLITFYVGGTKCTAEEGMTWAQFAASKYNTIGCTIHPAFGVVMAEIPAGSTSNVMNLNGVSAKSTETITANGSYQVS